MSLLKKHNSWKRNSESRIFCSKTSNIESLWKIAAITWLILQGEKWTILWPQSWRLNFFQRIYTKILQPLKWSRCILLSSTYVSKYHTKWSKKDDLLGNAATIQFFIAYYIYIQYLNMHIYSSIWIFIYTHIYINTYIYIHIDTFPRTQQCECISNWNTYTNKSMR